jgi:hypothetical protein
MSGAGSSETGPLVVCLVCAADDQPRRVVEIEALALGLTGTTSVEHVTGRTTAIRVQIPEAAASRFAAALVFNGAVVLELRKERLGSSLIVLLTAEPPT